MSETAALVPATVSEAVDAVANAPETISKLFVLAEKLVYGTGYTAGYIVAFPLALIFAAIPKRNALVRGMIEGTADAQARAQRLIG